MSADQSKNNTGSTVSALLAQGSLYTQLAWVEFTIEKHRLMHMLILLMVGASLLTSLIVSLTVLVIITSWFTHYRMPVLVLIGVFYSVSFISLLLGFNALSRKATQAFSDTREELTEDLDLIRRRFDQ